MSETEGVYAVWLREFKVYLRERERVAASIISPLLWILVFGVGVGASVTLRGTTYQDIPYQEFIYPGILVMTVLFTSLFFGVYIIWDRKLDFLKEVLVAPVTRVSIFLGKMLGGCTDAMIQAVFVLLIGFIIGMPITVAAAVKAFLILTLISTSLVSLGLFIGANLNSPEGFNLVIGFVMWPLFFFSGALFPIENLPEYLFLGTRINPLSYGVDAVRGSLLGIYTFPLQVDILVMFAFTIFAMLLGIESFRRM